VGGRVRRAPLGQRFWTRSALLLVALATAGAAHSRIDTSTAIDQAEIFVPQPEQARLSALGFDALLADHYWLRALQLVGGERMGVGGYESLVGRLIDVVTSLNPWVGHPYRFAAVWLTESPEGVRSANALLERAVAYHPRDWRNRHYLGFNHFFFLGDTERAADVLEGAVGLPGAPGYLGGLVARLRLDRDGLDTAAAFLAELVGSTQDEYARAAHLRALDEIETERRARFLDAARAEYQRRQGRDIAQLRDLTRGADPVLRALPAAHPHFAGFAWELAPESGEIVSSFYGSRYRLHDQEQDRARRERWARDRQPEGEG
jgi:hypothetical protein